MKELWINFAKGIAVFIIGSGGIFFLFYKLLIFSESSIFDGEIPDEYRLAGIGVSIVLVILLSVPTLIKPGRAIQIEKDREITQMGITDIDKK